MDINDVFVNTELPVQERLVDFIEQIKNPYIFRSGDFLVKVTHTGKQKLDESLERILNQSWA